MANIDSIKQKYLQGKTTEEENQQLLRWINESEDNKKQFFAAKDIWDCCAFNKDQKQYDTDSELKLLKISLEKKSQKSKVRYMLVLKVAAVLLVTFGIGWFSRYFSSETELQYGEVCMHEIFVPKGQVNQIFLADGTRIWMNSETKLIAPSVFSNKERVVKLSGEAFFEVAKDKKRPFKVEVNGQKIVVVGTSFNVRSYGNSDKIETTLQSGSIRLETGKQYIMLHPGDQCIFEKTTNKLTVNKVDPITFSSWKEGRYEFQNEDLLEVFKVVERWYDVKIITNEKYFKGMHFSGVIKRNKDALHFVEMLNLSIPVSYTIEGDKIQILPKISKYPYQQHLKKEVNNS